MTDIKEWDDLPLHKKINVFPNRHPFPVKAMLYLAFNVAEPPYWSWAAVYKVLERMGYIPVTAEEDAGGGMTLTSKGWTRP